MDLPTLVELEDAARVVYAAMPPTPQYAWPLLAARTGARVYVPIGLGSGICGALAAREALGRRLEVVGVVSAGAPAYARAFESGAPDPAPVATEVADGMAVRTPDREALALIRRGVARIVEVEDGEVEAAMAALFRDTHSAAEGAGAAGLAALLKEREANHGLAVGLVLTGANVDADRFAGVLRRAAPIASE